MRGKRSLDIAIIIRQRLIPACAGKTPPPRLSGYWVGAHPRVCGENRPVNIRLVEQVGSSPRVRGKLLHGLDPQVEAGLIPACAGKTLRARRRSHALQAHPRVCGENFWVDTRGHQPIRLIPACAGKTWRRPWPGRRRRAHPRVCGENPNEKRYARMKVGSSPRVRGKQPPKSRKAGIRRLIPACAGKTRCRDRSPLIPWAHPRVCGENSRSTRYAFCPSGSSPRVRGKRLRRWAGTQDRGLIPACAGKTNGSELARFSPTAHPRVCGENPRASPACPRILGSSPRVRGKHDRSCQRPQGRGLIPACAGKTTVWQMGGAGRGAHPRVCGENKGRLPQMFSPMGSSPRVRGKLASCSVCASCGGLIPACAGKTGRLS